MGVTDPFDSPYNACFSNMIISKKNSPCNEGAIFQMTINTDFLTVFIGRRAAEEAKN